MVHARFYTHDLLLIVRKLSMSSIAQKVWSLFGKYWSLAGLFVSVGEGSEVARA